MTRAGSDGPSLRKRWESQSAAKAMANVAVAAVAAVCAAWVSAVFPGELFNLHTAIWTFLVVWAGLVGYFIYLRISTNVLGFGCYIIGLSLILKPPVDLSNEVLYSGSGLRATSATLVSEFFTSSLLFAVLGFAVIGLGMLLRRRGRQQRQRKMRSMLRTEE